MCLGHVATLRRLVLLGLVGAGLAARRTAAHEPLPLRARSTGCGVRACADDVMATSFVALCYPRRSLHRPQPGRRPVGVCYRASRYQPRLTSATSAAPLTIVTGAASGIGWELADQLAHHGRLGARLGRAW